MAYRNGLHDPPTMEPIFGSDPSPVPPLYSYPVLFPSGDPTQTPIPPFRIVPPSAIPPAPVPVAPKGPALSGNTLLIIGGIVAAVLLMKGRR